MQMIFGKLQHKVVLQLDLQVMKDMNQAHIILMMEN